LVVQIIGYRPTAWRSADWPPMQDYLHYTYSTTKEHTSENTKPKANSAAAPGWAANDFFTY